MQKKILIADDDTVAREMLARHIVSGSDRFEILNADDEYQALNKLSLKNIDLLIIDLQLIHKDAFLFLTQLINEYPQLSIFVITAFGTSEMQRKIQRLRNCLYFEKPLELNAIRQTITRILVPNRLEGRITGLRLSAFLHMVQEERKTCQLQVWSQNRTGHVRLSNGTIVSARTGGWEGMNAVNEIAGWDDVTIEILEEDAAGREPKANGPDGEPRLQGADPAPKKPPAPPIRPAAAVPNRKKTEAEDQGQEFSEHYSLTQDFITQIEQLQEMNAMALEEQGHDERPAPPVPSQKPAPRADDPVVIMLKDDPDIGIYRIYDRKNRILATSPGSESLPPYQPSVFYKPALSIQSCMDARSFLCMMIRTPDMHHLLFRHRKKWFWLAVNPNFPINRLLEKPLRGITAAGKQQEIDRRVHLHIARDEKMETTLDQLNKTPGIMGSYVLSLKKRVIANKMPPVFTDTKLLTMGKLLVKIYLAGKMSMQEMSEITLFYQESVLTLREVADQAYLVVLYDPAMRINHLFTAINLIMPDLKRQAGDPIQPVPQPVKQPSPAPVPAAAETPAKKPVITIEAFLENEDEEDDSAMIDPETLISSGPMAGVLQEMQTALTKVIGPIAPILFTAALKEWIATDRPDFGTIQGLVDILQKEIDDPERFQAYQKKITPYIWVNN